jgi:hypothetical protein
MGNQAATTLRVGEYDRHSGLDVGRIDRLHQGERPLRVGGRHARGLDRLEPPAEQECDKEDAGDRRERGDADRRDVPSRPSLVVDSPSYD